MTIYNTFSSMPYIPYKIIMALFENDALCKLLKYNTYDCLSMPNLTYDEKANMIWKSLDGKSLDNRMDSYNIFLTNTMANEMTETKSMLQCYRYNSKPDNHLISTLSYRFDFLFGSTIAMVEYEGIPCSRGDVFEMELMESLNGKDVAGVGYLQYNREVSRLCESLVGIGNNSTFTGISIIMSTRLGDVRNDKC